MYDRLAVPEAAQALGLTEGAIRQRIQRGTLESERDTDGRVYVLVRRDNGRDNGDKTSSNTRLNGGFNAHSETVEILKNQNEFLKGQLEAEREANRENRRIIAGLVQRVPELEAPRGPRDGHHEMATAEPDRDRGHPATEGAQEGAALRPWWQRWFGFE
jgi:hypothetical protein